jgi:tRNA 2-thiouridine synthesizing protein D
VGNANKHVDFSVLITASPFTHQAPSTAYRFCKAVLAKGHHLKQVFFYQDGVYVSSALHCPPYDEFALTEHWQALAKAHHFELVVCVAAALRRGILDAEQAEAYAKKNHNLAEGFKIAGLGQLLNAIATSDRFITFGG